MFHHNTYRSALLGLDLGQSQDPSALTLLLDVRQISSHHSWFDATHPATDHWLVAAAQVFPLGASFTEVSERVVSLCCQFRQQHPRTPLTLLADATGLGRPVLELLYRELSRRSTPALGRPAVLEGVIFTGGHQGREPQRHPHSTLPIDIYTVPKLTLLNSLATAIEVGLLKVPATLPEKETLFAQLKALEIHYPAQHRAEHHGPSAIHAGLNTQSPRDPIIRLNPTALSQNRSTLAHADLVMSLALATWRLQLKQRPATAVRT